MLPKPSTALSAVTLLCAMHSHACAQAWIPPERTVSASLSFQATSVADHLFSQDVILEDGTNLGNEVDLGKIDGRTVVLQLDYGATKRLAVSGSIGYVEARYDHEFMGGALVEDPIIDDGTFHGGFQDASLGVRYVAYRGPVVITPSIVGIVPTNDYPLLGHAARGRNLAELQFGINVGRSFSGIVDGYVHASYAYGWVENFATRSLDRSLADVAAGVFITPRLSVRGFGSFFDTHDGIDWLEIGHEGFHAHDAGAKAKAWRAGGAVNFSVIPALGVSLGYGGTLAGGNTHDAKSFTISTSYAYSFR